MKQSYCASLIAILLTAISTPLAAQESAAAVADAPPSRFEIPSTDAGLPGSGPIRRADWFASHWRDLRSKWADQVERDQGAVVFLGDSITEGWGDRLNPLFPGVKVANRGISGDTSRGVLIRLKEDVLALNPGCVVLLIGTNDIDEDATPETIAGNVKLILAALKQHDPEMPIVLCRVMPSSASKDRPAETIQKLNELYAKAVYDDPQVTLINTWKLFANDEGDAKPAEFPDLLHPNDAGYRKWAAALRPIFATLGLMDAGPDDFELESGFESLFNGRDLTGWGYRPTSDADRKTRQAWQDRDPNAAAWPIVDESVSFDGMKQTPDGRFVAINGRLVVTTPPKAREIRQLYTERDFPRDFTLKLEFRATPFADSGVYLRGPQLQCRDYSTAGPYFNLEKYQPQQWNEMVVTVRDNVAQCTCNGEVLEKAFKLPDTGPIGVEGDRGQMEYRRIRIRDE